MSEDNLAEKLKLEPPEELAVSLSGGGHRATLYGLGVLMALVDRKLNRRVRQITSVSGGSITNAFVAINCEYSAPNLTSEGFDSVSSRLVTTIIRKGVLTKPVIALLLVLMLVPPVSAALLASAELVTWLVAVPFVVLWSVLALLRGLVIELLLELRYSPPRLEWSMSPLRLRIVRKRLSNCLDARVEHVFVGTDLLQAQPAYFSSAVSSGRHEAGTFWSAGNCASIAYTVRFAGDVPVCAAVRASAAFPGIPPRLFKFRTQEADLAWPRKWAGLNTADAAHHLDTTVLLADGGVWNNLGSHILRELDWAPLRRGPMALLVADAATPLTPHRVIPYLLPGWALVRSLLRMVNILTYNTVEPRVKQLRRRHLSRLFSGGTGLCTRRLAALCEALELDERQSSELSSLNKGGYLAPDESWDIPLALSQSPTWVIDAAIELARNIGRSSSLLEEARSAAAPLLTMAGKVDAGRIGTHLGRVPREEAVALLVNGYVSAFFATTELKPLGVGDVVILESLPERLQRLVAPPCEKRKAGHVPTT
jgi:hypothetical protein